VSEAGFLIFETGGTKLVAGLADAEARLVETRVLRRNPEDRAEQSFGRLVAAGRELAGAKSSRASDSATVARSTAPSAGR